jgi:protein disulfide-isomerase
MNIEIWSDVVCPFCYIGKRHFEKALEQVPDKVDIKITWRSFELNPDAPNNYPGDLYDMLAARYRTTRQGAIEMNKRVLEMAEKAGLKFDLDAVKPSNSFDAHRLIKLAAKHGLQDIAEETFFAAFFSRGLNIGEKETLGKIGEEIGLKREEVDSILSSDLYADEVRTDERMATQFGISGVPFFVFDRKYGLSGAQPIDVFREIFASVRKEREKAGTK